MTTFEHSGEKYLLPTGSWSDRTPNDQYDDVQAVQDAYWAAGNDAKKQEVLAKNGFQSIEQMEAYHSLITSQVDFVAYGQAKANRMMEEQRKKLNDNAAAMKGTEIMAPISGVSLETYAHINAALAQGKDYKDLLREAGIELVSWEKASEGWLDRMRTDGSFTVTNEYSKFFMSAGQGQFASTGKNVAGEMNGTKGKDEDPLSLDRYAEIMAAQGAAMAQGKDASSILATYGLNAADWGTVGIYWANKMMSDMNVGMKFSELFTKYQAQFESATPSVADDINF